MGLFSWFKSSQRPAPPPFEEGAVVVYPGIGLGTVIGTESHAGRRFLRVQLEAGAALVPVDQAANALRAPCAHHEAERLLSLLRADAEEPDTRSSAERSRDLRRVVADGTLERQAHALRQLYRVPFAPSFDERRFADMLEQLVVAEIAHVIGRETEALVQEVRATHRAFESTTPRSADPAPERPNLPVTLEGHEPIGAFDVGSGAVVVGENLSQAVHRIRARDGRWFAFIANDNRGEGLVAVCEQHAARTTDLYDVAELLGRASVEGGTIAIIDAAKRETPEVIDGLRFPLRGCEIVAAAGVVSFTRGDGLFPVFAVLDDGVAVLVRILL